ncbi:sensor histidine kinase [Paenibacillus sp. NEAU-GSW1]|uniref:sensor histidine kinase n=1 Tax=Paenibacillus sp. NEAU-GSW1 TaxID=2682486 RepID=UPI0012E15E9B|nr:sensor histidine kinase [Paenibacillus sp. NEAU-GSW1]MUT66129.1 hypothetical protein [Paenibacillus sp. NEAU-GSW1]
MIKWLNQIRTLLVAIPSIATLMTINLENDLVYSATIMLALLFIRLPLYIPRFSIVLLIAELIGFGWLAYTYKGILFLLPFATLIGVFAWRPTPQISFAWTGGGAIVLLTALDGREPEIITAVLLLWCMTAGIMHALNRFEARQQQTENLYDKLARSHEELEAARRRVIEYASQIERYAQTEERNRIAKDIHDDLGHRLIRVKMMSEAAIQLFDSNPSRSFGLLTQIRDQLQESMENMRRTVRRLAVPEPDESRRYALDRLVNESAAAIGIDVSFIVSGNVQPLYPSVEMILYMNAQEAITNAVRHGGATAIDIVLDFKVDIVSLAVSNNGSLPKEPVAPGLGMRGMKERMALVKGELSWSVADRFVVTTAIPLKNERVKEQKLAPTAVPQSTADSAPGRRLPL